ncbi:MAG: tetratricopeptide repeat protein [Spirochaetes bacterium]|nr:tetratricopeptide repeat protein [Spirochaetota bacterium]
MNLSQTIRDYAEIASGFIARFRVLVVIVVAFLVLAFGSWLVFSTVQSSKEKEVSRTVNRLSIELINLAQNSESSLEAQDRIAAIYAELEKTGRANLRTQNGLRALFLSAHGEMQTGQFAKAREKYLLVHQKNPGLFQFGAGRHYLAANALYYAALATEEEGQIDKAIELLRKFERSYPTHWLLGEVQLSIARNLAAGGKMDQAVALFDKMLADKNLEPYHARVSDQKKILMLRGVLPKQPLLQSPPKFLGN